MNTLQKALIWIMLGSLWILTLYDDTVQKMYKVHLAGLLVMALIFVVWYCLRQRDKYNALKYQAVGNRTS